MQRWFIASLLLFAARYRVDSYLQRAGIPYIAKCIPATGACAAWVHMRLPVMKPSQDFKAMTLPMKLLTFDIDVSSVNKSNYYEFSAEFVDIISKKLQLTTKTVNSLRKNRVTPQEIISINLDKASFFKISKRDSSKILGWAEQERAAQEQKLANEKAAEEKKLAFEKAAQEQKLAIEKAAEEQKLAFEKAALKKKIAIELTEQENEMKRRQRLEEKEKLAKHREKLKKSIFIVHPKTKNIERIILYDKDAFIKYLSEIGIVSLKILCQNGSFESVPTLIRPDQFQDIENDAFYSYGDLWYSDADTTLKVIEDTTRKVAEFNFASELSALYNQTISYVGSDVKLMNSKEIIGDVDSLFRSASNNTFYLLERKTTLSDDMSQLVAQLEATKDGFLLMLSDESFRKSVGVHDTAIDVSTIAIEQGVFFEAGSDAAANALREAGYHVLSRGRTFRPRKNL